MHQGMGDIFFFNHGYTYHIMVYSYVPGYGSHTVWVHVTTMMDIPGK